MYRVPRTKGEVQKNRYLRPDLNAAIERIQLFETAARRLADKHRVRFRWRGCEYSACRRQADGHVIVIGPDATIASRY
jgi:hypothetical protein